MPEISMDELYSVPNPLKSGSVCNQLDVALNLQIKVSIQSHLIMLLL